MSDERTAAAPETQRQTTRQQQAQPAPAQDQDALVDAWFNECIVRSPIAKNTDTYNAAHKALGELKRRLAAGR